MAYKHFAAAKFLIAVFLLPISQGLAATVDEMHVESAFIFAKKKVWSEAISHAKLADNQLLAKYFTWEYLKDPESDASFAEITDFLDNNPDWPDRTALEKRAEVALMADNPSDEVLAEWFEKHPPQTNFVKQKISKNPEELKKFIRLAWVNDGYGKAAEEKFITKYRSFLRSEDHIARIDRLIWEGKIDEAKRIIKYAPLDYQLLFKARLALLEDATHAPFDVIKVPGKLKNHPGLLYARLLWRVKRSDKEGVRELLLAAPSELPYADKWWNIFDRQIRDAIGEDDITLAEKLLAKHKNKKAGNSYKEAEWLRGWIDLEYKHSPETAYNRFSILFDELDSPASKSRAAYWAARAAEKINKGNPARWFGEASHYSTTFYGQVAAWELNKKAKTVIRSSATPSSEERNKFKQKELVRLVNIFAQAKQSDLAARFIYYLSSNAKSEPEGVLASELGREIKRIDFGVRASKKLLQKNIVSLDSGWPIISVNNDDVEKALVLGLIRQESEFFANAVSSSNAHGLMQLLPSTANETAKKAGIGFSADRLFQPDYNTQIGSLYLSKLIERFDGSYIMAIAGYNAGPGRVRQWEANFGSPQKDVRSAINWIEKIPFVETRNYVAHVFENLQVYRFLLAGKKPVGLSIAVDLTK